MPEPEAAPKPPTATEPAELTDRDRRTMATVRRTAVVATLGVVVAVAGLGLALRPLRTPTQDCGTAFTFLAEGRVDVFIDPANPPPGVTRAEAIANGADPCQERAADRARPAGVAVVGGTLLALVALVVEWSIRVRHHRSWRRQWSRTAGATLPAADPAPPDPSR